MNSPFIQLMSIWELHVKLNKRRQSDPGLSWYDHCEAPSTARRKSKVKSQKSKVLWNGLFRDFKWLLYLRRGVLVHWQDLPSSRCADRMIFIFNKKDNLP
ncbi:hypothetical protein [Nostoc sp.]|uniref:hypothetical protein n=1 Tax=Nostoc sp. TaxID=1180 RepID=UPI002FF452BD